MYIEEPCTGLTLFAVKMQTVMDLDKGQIEITIVIGRTVKSVDK